MKRHERKGVEPRAAFREAEPAAGERNGRAGWATASENGIGLHQLAVGERPQERLQRCGAQALSDVELLAMVLRSGTQGEDVLALAARLLREGGSLVGLLSWTEKDFSRLRGIGPVKALQLLAVVEVARRILMRPDEPMPLLGTPESLYLHLAPLAAGLQVEKFWVMCLNRKNRLLRRVEATSGTASASLVHPREVFREAIRAGASAVLCAHNHPSGDPAPSSADLQVTRQLREAAKVVDITLLDHVILGRPEADAVGRGWYSFREAGLI